VKLVTRTPGGDLRAGQYDRDAARIICDGNPVLRDGETEVSAKRLTYLNRRRRGAAEEAVQATVRDAARADPEEAGPGRPGQATPPRPGRHRPTQGGAAGPARPAGGGP